MTFFLVYQFFYYWTLFVLFLPINRDKPHCFILNIMGAMIFWFIKLSEVMNLIQYAIQDLKNHKLFNNGPKIKNYTIFGKEKVWKFWIYPQILALINVKVLKGALIAKCIRKRPSNDLYVTLKGQGHIFWSNGWFYWTQEAKTYRKRGIYYNSRNLSFFGKNS